MDAFMGGSLAVSGERALMRSLEPILKRTLGVPLFQEQLLRLAMVARLRGLTAAKQAKFDGFILVLT